MTDSLVINKQESTKHTTRVVVQFLAEDVATDLTLGELRAALAAAGHLPDTALVEVQASAQGWGTPARLSMTHEVVTHHCPEGCPDSECLCP